MLARWDRSRERAAHLPLRGGGHRGARRALAGRRRRRRRLAPHQLVLHATDPHLDDRRGGERARRSSCSSLVAAVVSVLVDRAARLRLGGAARPGRGRGARTAGRVARCRRRTRCRRWWSSSGHVRLDARCRCSAAPRTGGRWRPRRGRRSAHRPRRRDPRPIELGDGRGPRDQRRTASRGGPPGAGRVRGAAGRGGARARSSAREAAEAAELAEVNELRTAILAAVSHDLRTPLASIKAAVSSLRQDDVAWNERGDRGVPRHDRGGDRPPERRWLATCWT